MTENMIAVPRALLEGIVETIERADTSEGWCCCGDSMENHGNPMDCGHSPVDAGDYFAGKWVDEIQALLAAPSAPAVPEKFFDREALECISDWLKTHDLTVNVGAVQVEDCDEHIQSSAGWLLELLTAMLAATPAPEKKES